MKLPISIFVGTLLLGNQAYAREHKLTTSMRAIPHTSVTFNVGSAALSEADKASIRKVVQDARSKGTLQQVTVAAWSDKTLPRRGQKLMDQDRDLADMRANAIRDVLKAELAVTDVDTYNMAENSNWLARTFNTRDAELKSVFARRGEPVPVTNSEYHLIREVGGPSEAVVLVELKIP